MKKFNSILIVFVMLAMMTTSVFAYDNSVTFSGQGLIADGFGGYDLRTELCGVANGADAEGPYLLWVLTASKANNADITGPWGTAAMTKFGNGTFKFISGWYDPSTLPDNVTATYDGKTKNAQLVVSHGCRPFTNGAWCSPGFWKNASVGPVYNNNGVLKGPGAWSVVGKSPSDLFDGFVYDYWFGNSLPGITLGTVLNDPTTYSGAPVAGGSGHALNAYNATGAALTNLIPGYQFDWDVMVAGGSDACPIDHFGNFK